jgi:trk system potassium uptake protein TrkH
MFNRPLLAIGFLLCGLAALELVFAAADAVVADANWRAFLISGVMSGVIGAGLTSAFWSTSGDERQTDHRSAFILTALSWTVLPLMASLPFYFSEIPVSFTDAVFETVSGITTTGSTVIAGLDSLDPMLLLWRSVLQWFGGVGIIVMAIIMMPFLRIGGAQLFQLESSARTDGGVIARPMTLIRSIAALYAALTMFCAAAYMLAGMSTFDAVNHAMTTLATGGYSTHDASIGFFDSKAILWASVVFMIAGALPFMAYMRTMNGRPAALAEDPQAPLFLVLLVGTWFIAAGFLAGEEAYLDKLLRAAVNITSVVTTTGYASEDYQLWGPGFVGLFFALTFVGGCAGSTSGGIKIYRFQLLRIFAAEHLRRLYSPSLVEVTSYGGVRLTREIAFSVLAFLSLFIGAFSLGALALTFTGLDIATALSSSITALSNVGPGVGDIVGPAGNFASLPDAAKWILIALMLLGRLELFAILVMFDPYFWR